MEPHATRIVVWDVPPAVECGAPFRVKVGVKCAAECGAAAAEGATRVLGASLYQVSPLEPRIFLGTALLLLAVATAACLLPALRATRVDPNETLRAE